MEVFNMDTHQIKEPWQQQVIGNDMLKAGQIARETVPEIQASETAQSDAHDVLDTKSNRDLLRAAIKQYQSTGEQDDKLRHRLEMHAKSGKLQMTLVNYMTGETVEKIPSSKLIEFRSELEKMGGLVVEATA